MTTQLHYFEKELKPAQVPIWRETLGGIDWLLLRYSPVYYGLGVPRGDGSAAILIPGFLASDLYLHEMHWWLGRIGYRSYLSHIGRNANCFDVLSTRLFQTIERAHAETGRKVHLIGHSLGGVLARSAAARRPDLIASVITMASPFRGIRSHALVLEASEAIRSAIQSNPQRTDKQLCYTGECRCEAMKGIKSQPAPDTSKLPIYTKTDGIVDWRACIDPNPANNVEVRGTHVGLVFNPGVYRHIAQWLVGIQR